MTEIISYGGGIQTTALAILNASGDIKPRCSHAVFADTGGEFPATLEHIEIMRPWLAARGIELVVARIDRHLPLPEYIRQHSAPIPMRFAHSRTGRGAQGHRHCTVQWKIEPIENWLKSHNGADGAIVQIGFSWDEVHRMRENPRHWITNRFPLIEQRITRQGCIRIIEDAGLPVPPKSACWFCPMRSVGAWQHLASWQPYWFEQAAQIEDCINARRREKRQAPAYLSSRLRPLRKAFSTAQLPLPFDEAEFDGCGGLCWT